MISNSMVCVQDFENFACANLPKQVFDYYRGGSGNEVTLKLNRKAFKNFRIVPRMLKDVSNRDLSLEVFGDKISIPVGIAPAALQKMAHPDGEIANAKAAEEIGTIFILSTISTTSIEEMAKAVPHAIKWFQLYIYKNREMTKSLVQRAENAGFKALVVTVDTPMFGIRKADLRNKFTLPPSLSLANFTDEFSILKKDPSCGSSLSYYVNELFDESINWNDIKWLQTITGLPIVLKGIMCVDDALLAVNYGVAGILVSNHGARQLDGVPATIQVLHEIKQAVNDKCEVFLDGGITQGTDIFKALALGAKMVFIGRPALWGLTFGGQNGVKTVLTILKNEFDNSMALSGCRKNADIKCNMVLHKSKFNKM